MRVSLKTCFDHEEDLENLGQSEVLRFSMKNNLKKVKMGHFLYGFGKCLYNKNGYNLFTEILAA
jgi:hypothetical protein